MLALFILPTDLILPITTTPLQEAELPTATLPFVPIITTVTSIQNPRWTWTTRGPFAPSSSILAGAGGGIKNSTIGDSNKEPTLVLYGLSNTLAFVVCLMLIPSVFVWCCMRRPIS
ncbi:hypothetical protein BX616_000659, partial [Lobosporangium transversale]